MNGEQCKLHIRFARLVPSRREAVRFGRDKAQMTCVRYECFSSGNRTHWTPFLWTATTAQMKSTRKNSRLVCVCVCVYGFHTVHEWSANETRYTHYVSYSSYTPPFNCNAVIDWLVHSDKIHVVPNLHVENQENARSIISFYTRHIRRERCSQALWRFSFFFFFLQILLYDLWPIWYLPRTPITCAYHNYTCRICILLFFIQSNH